MKIVRFGFLVGLDGGDNWVLIVAERLRLAIGELEDSFEMEFDGFLSGETGYFSQGFVKDQDSAGLVDDANSFVDGV